MNGVSLSATAAFSTISSADWPVIAIQIFPIRERNRWEAIWVLVFMLATRCPTAELPHSNIALNLALRRRQTTAPAEFAGESFQSRGKIRRTDWFSSASGFGRVDSSRVAISFTRGDGKVNPHATPGPLVRLIL